MPNPATLPLSQIVDVQIFVAPQAPASPTFNQGLIVGPSTVIPSYGNTNPRTRKYLNTAQILADGFTVNSPEYIAASIYFGQSPAPAVLWIGRQDLTSLASISIGAAGTGYVVGDVVGLTQGGASAGLITVTTIGGGGAVTGVAIAQNGTGYSVAGTLATTGGTGTGLTINVLSIGETPLVALQNCRTSNLQWWACMVTSAVKADHIAIAGFVQTMKPVGCYFYTTADADALAGTTGNVFSVLKIANYNRSFGQYATTQSGLFPNNAYACAAAMGAAMGLNTGLANSAFTEKFKQEVGVATEPLTVTSIGVIEGNNGNLYLSYGNTFSMLEQGVLSNGQFFDEILNLDMLSSAIQFAIMGLLTSAPKIPQTDPGQTRLIHAINTVAEDAFNRGFLGAGVWNGVQILNLSPGDSLPHGYSVQSPPYSTQLTSDRQARKSMPIYVAIVEAGAVHSILIGVYVQR